MLPTSMDSASNELVAPIALCGARGGKAHELALLRELHGLCSDLLPLHIHGLRARAAGQLVLTDVPGRIMRRAHWSAWHVKHGQHAV